MTVIIPESGFRARLRRATSGAAVFAIALGVCGIAATSAHAADKTDDAVVELHLSAGANGAATPGLSTSASVTVQNGTGDALSTGHVVVELNRTALADRAAVADWFESEDADGAFDRIADDSTAAVNAGASATSSIPLPQELFADLAPGVYPLRAELTGASPGSGSEEDATATSVLVVSAAQRPQVAVLVPITATPQNGALLSIDELTELTAADGDLTAQLDGVSGTSAVLAIDPAIPAAIRVLGTSAPTSVTEWLDRLDALPNERFALQFGDADATTQAQADLPSLLAPTTLAPFLDPKNFQAPATPTPDATPSPTPTDGPVLPDDETLSVVDGAAPGILWPRGDVTTDDLADFRTYLGGTASTVLPSTSLSSGSSGHAAVGDADVLVTDAAASDALSTAANEPDATARSRSLAAANAYLFLSAQQSAAPLIVGLDRDENRTADALRDAVTTADSPGVDLTSVRAAPAGAASVDSDVDDDRGAALHRMLADEVTLGSFSTILSDPQLLLSPERIRILRTIGVGHSAAQFEKALRSHTDATQDTLAAVDIPQSSTIQLLSANADLPFSVRNDLPWPVNIVLYTRPSDPRLEVKPVTTAEIQARTTGRVKVPVSARVGSGELDLHLSLKSPTGVSIGQDQTVRVAVRAEWEGIGLAVFGSLIAILLVLGIVRTLRRRRKNRDEAPQDAETDAAADEEPSENVESDAENAEDAAPDQATGSHPPVIPTSPTDAATDPADPSKDPQ